MRVIRRTLMAAAYCFQFSAAEWWLLHFVFTRYPWLALLLFCACVTITGIIIGWNIGSMETLWKVLDCTALPTLDELDNASTPPTTPAARP